ncbi:histidine kinase [Dactylosporangium sp. NPDC005572]|uniref:sensor histidine kinase n=1 Tax=Dactylosporangium sp. NPDC005572 TaxID=3156889 RepID=UPI0033BF26B0
MTGLADIGRRLLAWRDWPVVSGVLLAVAGVAEAHLVGLSDEGVAASVAATAPLAVRHRFPTVVAVVVAAAVVALLTMRPMLPVTALVGQLAVLYQVAARHRRRLTGLAVIPLAGNAVYPYSGDSTARPLALLLLCLGLAAAWLGDARRVRGQLLTERAILDERSRIARELHDVVAHHVSLMVVRAETARVATPGLPAAGRESLAAIRDTGREALTELRRLLTVLRADPDEPAARNPQPGLDQLDELVAAARVGGMPVTLRREGVVHPVPAGVELCAYRIIQEALTNVRRHAPGASATVVLRHGDGLWLSVRDDGGPAPAVREGHGLLGMRERAALVGGVLRAGPTATGFLVEADLPTGGPR